MIRRSLNKKSINLNTHRFSLLNRVVINQEFKLAYNRIQKNANSSIVMLMHSIANNHHSDVGLAKEKLTSLRTMSLTEISELHSYKFFTVVRNPYSRTLSAFLDKFRREDFRQLYGDFSLDKKGFSKFLRWLDEGGIHENSHWDLQAKQLLIPITQFDHVFRFENFSEELLAFLENMGVTKKNLNLSKSVRTPRGRIHNTQADDLVKYFYDNDNKQIIRSCLKEDFEILDYDLDGLGTE